MNNEGEGISLEQLYDAHFKLLYHLARRQLYQYTGSAEDASDMVQDVFVVAARKWPELRDHPAPKAWLIKTMDLVCKNHVRARYRQQTKENHSKDQVMQRQPKAYGPLYSDAVDDATSAQDVLITLERALKEEDYQILKAYCIDKRSMEEIGRQTGLSGVALRVRIHRIREKVAKIFILLVTFMASRNI